MAFRASAASSNRPVATDGYAVSRGGRCSVLHVAELKARTVEKAANPRNEKQSRLIHTVTALIWDCWQIEPEKRPGAHEVSQRLQDACREATKLDASASSDEFFFMTGSALKTVLEYEREQLREPSTWPPDPSHSVL